MNQSALISSVMLKNRNVLHWIFSASHWYAAPLVWVFAEDQSCCLKAPVAFNSINVTTVLLGSYREQSAHFNPLKFTSCQFSRFKTLRGWEETCVRCPPCPSNPCGSHSRRPDPHSAVSLSSLSLWPRHRRSKILSLPAPGGCNIHFLSCVGWKVISRRRITSPGPSPF